MIGTVITFMHGIYSFVRKTVHVSTVYNIAAILDYNLG